MVAIIVNNKKSSGRFKDLPELFLLICLNLQGFVKTKRRFTRIQNENKGLSTNS